MCVPLSCSTPRTGVGTFLSGQLPGSFTPEDAQGIDDVVKDICKAVINKIGCAERQSRGEGTVWAFSYREVVTALRKAFPRADSVCLTESVRGILEALSTACQKLPNQNAFLKDFFKLATPYLGNLLTCLFTDRAPQIELAMWRRVAQLGITEIITCLLPILFNLLCNGGGIGIPGIGGSPCGGIIPGPPVRPGDPPIFGKYAPAHIPVVTRGAED